MINDNELLKMDEDAIEFDMLKQCNPEKVAEIYERMLPELKEKFNLDIKIVEVEFEDENDNIEVKETERVILSDKATNYVEQAIKKEFEEREDLNTPNSKSKAMVYSSYYYVYLGDIHKLVYTTDSGTTEAGKLGYGEIFVLRGEDVSKRNRFLIRFMNPSGNIVNAYIPNLNSTQSFKSKAYNLYFGNVHYSGFKVKKQGYLYTSGKVKNGTISSG
ncbi:hypothetical protein LZ906_017190 (plasmid) [Paraclostridium ghonii]|uniref:hypothetical protein n=1 Tax=Paraclostridium ghonii TaxID=29358 RepID=UPI00202CDFB2|nr:hypothetical protein [Paeniclostridium ghonii]MCM0165418.1 hypothetical protein [Paeniclostridium ghonii]